MLNRIVFAMLFCVLVFAPFSVLAQNTATVSGKITDESGDPLPGANVFIQLTNLGAATDINGEYEFTVPSSAVQGQEVTLEVRFIGYHTKTEKLTLTPGSHSLDFSLTIDALEMDAILVTGVVDETPKAKMSFSIGHVSRKTLEQVPAVSAEVALRGKVAGVKVVQGSGEPGTDASLLLRGATSINATGRSQDPLYIVDGIIIDSSISGSPLSDINADDIVNIEVVKGAAGASLYGSRAANGVVNITTNRGKGLALNQTSIRIRNEFGVSKLRKDLPLNRSHWFKIHEGTNDYTDANGIKVTTGDFIDNDGNFIDPRQKGGARRSDVYVTNFDASDPTQVGKGSIFFSDNPYKWSSTGDILIDDNLGLILDPATGQPVGLELLPSGRGFNVVQQVFDPGTFLANSVSLTRNMLSTNFSVSLANNRQDGVIQGLEGFKRQSVRLALDHRFRRNFSVSVNAFFSNVNRDDLGGNSDGGPGSGEVFSNLLFMSADSDLLKRHVEAGTKTVIFPDGVPENIAGDFFVQADATGLRENPLYEITNAERRNNRTRLMGSLGLKYRPADWFSLGGDFSYDRSNRETTAFFPVGYQKTEGIDRGDGEYSRRPAFDEAKNGNLTASLRRSFLNNELTIRSKARILFERSELQQTFAQGRGLAVSGTQDLNIANSQTLEIDSRILEVRSEGYSFITGFDYKDRYIGDVLIRRDGSSLFGPDERWHTYFRASGAYRLSQEPWWFTDKIQEFKIRASYGTAGNRPNFFSRFETWTVAAGNVSKNTLGNRALKPEFVKELELGVDLTFLNKYTLEVTRAESDAENQILNVPLASYFGYQSQWQNAGRLETNVWEFSLQAAPIQKRDMSFSFGINVDRLRQKITQLDVPAFNLSGGPGTFNLGFDRFRIEEGLAFGTLWGRTFIADQQDLLQRGLSQGQLSQFAVNDDGWVVWVGEGNSFRDGIAKELWGTTTELTLGDGDTETYEWGMPVFLRDADGGVVDGPIGSTVPDFNWSVFANLQWKGFSLYGLLDAQVGGDLYSRTLERAYGQERKDGPYDQFGKSDELKKPTLYYDRLGEGQSNNFVFDAGFVKLRELALQYSFNQGQLRGLFGGFLNKVTLGIRGRNLITWADYRGYDPEVGVSGGESGSAVIAKVDAFQYPNFRTFTGVIEFEL